MTIEEKVTEVINGKILLRQRHYCSKTQRRWCKPEHAII